MSGLNSCDATISEYKVIVQVMMLLSWIGFRGDTTKSIHSVWPTQLLDQSLEEKGREIDQVISYIEALPTGVYVCDVDLCDGSYKKYTREFMLTQYDFNVCGYLLFSLENPAWIIHKICDPVSVPCVFDIRDYCVRLTSLPKEILPF